MTLDWNIVIPSVIGFLGGGGLIGMLTFKQTKQGKALDNASKVVDKYEVLLEKYKAVSERNESKVEQLTEEVNELKRQLSIAQTQIANLQLLYTTANALRCDVLNCPHRQPPLNEEKVKSLFSGNEIN